MVQVTYPGVYIQEIPSGVKPITAVATSNGAFVGFFKEGPTNEATEINGMGDFNRIFGGLDRRSEAAYAISQFFLNGGSKAYVVRVVITDEVTTGGVTYPGAAAAMLTAKKGVQASADAIMAITAKNEGKGGNNLRVTVDPSPTDEQAFHLRVLIYDSPSANADFVAVGGEYLNLSVNSGAGRYFTRVIEDNSDLVEAEHEDFGASTDPATYARPAVTGTFGAWFSAPADFDTLKDKKAEIFVRTPKSGGHDEVSKKHELTLTWEATAKPTNMRQLRKLLETAVRTAKPTFAGAAADAPTHPSIAGVSVELLERVSDPATNAKQYRLRFRTDSGWSHLDGSAYSPHEFFHLTNTTDLVQPLGLNNAAANVQEYTLGTDDSFDRRAQCGQPTAASAPQVATKGEDGYRPDPTVDEESDASSEIAKALEGDPALKTGIYALEDADIFNILCIPVTAKLPDNEMTVVVSKALSFCEDQRAFMIIDIPANVDRIQDMKDWIDEFADFRTSYAATYFPRLWVPDPEDDYKKRSFGASGTAAGIYARTDSTRGVWKAPAGLDAGLEGVSELDYRMTDPENGSLNPIAINCLRVFPIHGKVVWGARTLDGADVQASEWKYIPIRRLALMIEESLYRGTHWVVFQPNDEPTWAKVRQNVGAFMFNLFRQGAFQGSTPKQAFYVKCDGETTTAIDRNLGIVNIEVGFAPLKPAEFVVIKIQQIPDIA